MNSYISELKQFFINEKKHHSYRYTPDGADKFTSSLSERNIPDTERSILRLSWVLEHERPVVLADEKISMIRTVKEIPEILTPEERAMLAIVHRIHELGKVSNINPGYRLLIDSGTEAKREEIMASIVRHKDAQNADAVTYLTGLLAVLDAIESFADRYRQEAERVGNAVVAESFSIIPRKKPETLLQALQFFRLLHFCLWADFTYHNTIGRFDQYMYPYYEADIKNGILDDEQALHLIEEFFISFNKDSDLYPGMQQGDNGQSIVLGGLLPSGKDGYNDLSQLCLKASLELSLIDPKINLRVHKETPKELYEFGTLLTKQGLGFPQYSNDDIVIPALEKWGYSSHHAADYVVAACWEFIIPEVAMDIVNIDALSFLKCIMLALPALPHCENFDDFLAECHVHLNTLVDQICSNTNNIYMEPSPLISLLMSGTIESGKDISKGALYNNYGIHGTGLSSAADSLAALKKYVFEEKSVRKERLLKALDTDFEDDPELFSLLRYDGPKMGNDDDYVDAFGVMLLDWFADALEGRHNDRGGIYRAGTGSAMYYLWHASELGASPDGRRKGEAFACNYSPSLFARTKGPVSLISSFSKAHAKRVANGGPLTLELHDTIFRNPESISKVAGLVKTYMDIGGMQLQLNSVNRDTMIDAQKYPEKYRNLIVRVWGWSGYFVELDTAYQNHIIRRTEFDTCS